jgi:heme/copper-type cytochrome/quinol oxidase subunit 2
MQNMNFTGTGMFNITGGSLSMDLTLSQIGACGKTNAQWYDFIANNKLYFIAGGVGLVIIVSVIVVFVVRYRKPKPTNERSRTTERVIAPSRQGVVKSASRTNNMLNY